MSQKLDDAYSPFKGKPLVERVDTLEERVDTHEKEGDLRTERDSHIDKRLVQAVAYSDLLESWSNKHFAIVIGVFTVIISILVYQITQFDSYFQEMLKTTTENKIGVLMTSEELKSLTEKVNNQNSTIISLHESAEKTRSELSILNTTIGDTPRILHNASKKLEKNQEKFQNFASEIDSSFLKIRESDQILRNMSETLSIINESNVKIQAATSRYDSVSSTLSEIKGTTDALSGLFNTENIRIERDPSE